MKLRLSLVAVSLALCAASALAQAPAGAPANATGLCKDGTYWTGTTKSGACRGHQGIQTWYGGSSAGSSSATATRSTSSAPAAAASHAATSAAPSGPAPANATGLCKDGTYWTGTTKSGACRGHQGVQTWYAGASAPAPASSSRSTPASATASAPAAPAPPPAAAPTPAAIAPKPSPATPKAVKQPATAAPGGGPGLVWVNTSTKVYHCYGDRYYGTTKDGKYMSEADAKAAGARPNRGTPCSK